MPAEFESVPRIPIAESLLDQIEASKKAVSVNERIGLTLLVFSSSIPFNSALNEQGFYDSLAENPGRFLPSAFILLAGAYLLKNARILNEQIRHLEITEGINPPGKEIEIPKD